MNEKVGALIMGAALGMSFLALAGAGEKRRESHRLQRLLNSPTPAVSSSSNARVSFEKPSPVLSWVNEPAGTCGVCLFRTGTLVEVKSDAILR